MMTYLSIIGIIVGILILICAIWWFPKCKSREIKGIKNREKWQAENEFRKTLIQVVGGIVVIAGLFITWAQLKQSQKEFRESQENMKVGQISSRFSKAIDQLGSDHAASRIGGIYALEQIVKEDPDNYLKPVIEVLSAFVRHAEYMQDIDIIRKDEAILPEVQSAITVISRIRTRGEIFTIDLKGANLRQADLKGANLQESILSDANLVQANLERANLKESDLIGTILRNAKLGGAKLDIANMGKAVLVKANLEGAKLRKAYLEGAILWDVNLVTAIMVGTILKMADLTNAKLKRAMLRGADFEGAILEGVEGLTISQLIEVKTLYNAKGLDIELEAELRKIKPELFEKPDRGE